MAIMMRADPSFETCFFIAMAVTIMGRLTCATIFTWIVVSVLYCTFYEIRVQKEYLRYPVKLS